MIEFNCFCKHRFHLEDDQAGGSIQCPGCGKLVDVPTLDDLHKLNADGTYTMGALELAPEPDRLARATRAFTRQRTDESGDQIDMRLTLDDVLKIGADEVVLHIKDDAEAKPKYDPITGELVRPIELKEEKVQPVIPMAKPALTYAQAGSDPNAGAGHALLEMFKPLNLVVMCAVLLAHLFGQVVLATIVAGIFFIAPVLVMVAVLIISHYGNVVDEIGPTARDELPRPLREASWTDDIWRPFKHVFASLIICFFPLMWLPNLPGTFVLIIGLPMFFLGSFFFPAVVLTLCTSGTVENMRPDRVMKVIGACGFSYLVAVFAWVIGIGIYAFGIYAYNYTFFKMFFKNMSTSVFFQSPVSLPILFLGIMGMHYFGWLVGLLYRKHHSEFPWVLQRHVSTRRKDTIAQLEERNRQRAAAAMGQPPTLPRS
ncbi:MAG TPA: hypothetical protein VL282_12600 [Tepidisphaeraceae bacterium]|jgi:hypothetical protein|nr:hypothetical protein [Tepidisphaeraceae bacterium]